VTHHFPLDNIEEAFTVFSHQDDGVLKVALHLTAAAVDEGLGEAAVGVRAKAYAPA
jgi:hypothetical protein